MTFQDYQDWMIKYNSAKYPLRGKNIVYPAMGLAGEAGELLDKIKKHWRNNSIKTDYQESMSATSLSPEQQIQIIYEMGDVLWYLHALCTELDISLDWVAKKNIDKIFDRIDRGTQLGEGDNR